MKMTIILISLGITLLILCAGILSMAIGGKFNQKYGSKLMMFRVIGQAMTILIIAILYFYNKS